MIQLQGGENIVLVCRRHWLIFFFVIIQFALMLVLIVASPILLGVFLPETSVYFDLLFLATLLITELIWVVFFLIITDYYLDAWIITNHRIIFIELHGIFSRTVSSVNLRDIQDISTQVHGILPTILKFGNVRIQSAGTAGAFVFKKVPDPYKVKDLILAAREKFLAG